MGRRGSHYDSYGYRGTTSVSDDGSGACHGLDLGGLPVLVTGMVELGLDLVLVTRRPWGRTG